jgi:hypothetical protein
MAFRAVRLIARSFLTFVPDVPFVFLEFFAD